MSAITKALPLRTPTLNPATLFSDAISAAGLTAPDVIKADGKLHRFASNGKRGDDAGWYVAHLDSCPVGFFGDWRSGQSVTWRADIGRKLTQVEATAQHAKMKAMRLEREAEEKRRHKESAKLAAVSWAASTHDPDDHGYLTRKGIKAHGLRLDNGMLVVPVYVGGKLTSLQFIGSDGSKRFMTGGEVKGGYYMIGRREEMVAICIVEGFATGASIYEAIGFPIAVAFNAGNLEPAAKALRKKFPNLSIVICADDDCYTEGNPGRTKAEAAALAVGGVAVFPIFHGKRPDGATDFNDLHQAEGLDAVKSIITGSIETVTTQENGHQLDAMIPSAADADSVATSAATPDATVATDGEDTASDQSPFPKEEDRPSYVVLDDWTEWRGRKYRPGVYHCGMTEEKKDSPPMPVETWFCAPLHIDAVTFDGQSNNFGRLLRFKNSLGRWRDWSMPMELLAGDGSALRGELLAMGLELDPFKARQQLPAYLQREHPKRRMHCALQVGWVGKSFVLPDEVIGPNAAGVIFQSGERGHEEHTKAGTLQGWQEGIAALAGGNPLLLLALSAGFAGPMLVPCNAEGGGIHFVGDSSTGKTTAIEASCSIWGGPNYRRSWRATANGMEGAAALFNDCLLALDEISECDPKEVGAIIYALGNGRGKQRASRSGTARGVTHWRCFVMSSGERTIGTTMLEGGHRAKAGQSVRLLDVPAARRFGAWDELHGAASAAAFSDGIKRVAAQHHGLVGRAFLEKLTHDSRDFCSMLETVKALPLFSADGSEGQDKRAAGRFALIGLSGELASEYGLTGWQEGEAINAAALSFGLWRAHRGKGNDERRQIAEQLSGFIERHGDGRFTEANDPGASQIRDRAGWWKDGTDHREYLLTAEAMRDALKGFDFKRALDILQELGALPKAGENGERTRFYRLGGRGMKLYPINADKLAASSDVT
jgi:putative DNA primase/helicase